MPNLTLGSLNTLSIVAASGAYRLLPQGYSRTLHVLNLGPGSIYIRGDATDPTVGDPLSLKLPSDWAQNDFSVMGGVGLGIIADANTTITVRVI